MKTRIKLAVIYGSVREGRFCDTVGNWVVEQVRARDGYVLDLIDPAENVTRSVLARQLASADAFVVVTPEYNHSYPAALKELIDTFYAEWQAKPVAFVSYGGASGGIRSVEHLRAVFAELHAVGIRDGIMFPNVWDQFNQQGQPVHSERAERSMTTMLNRLDWWARALRDARAIRDYAETGA
ncbi:NADPH-dependent FMN reductase [Aidingimonas lacisalsi]|uniref:NADPH-dependent FMN reductase n=1 Tax=Aidingimonas lacisalsi TaxID=2604086 RepID=UPI0011D18DB3|nr:NAD(P)H-dependent oxidoreductase [Aidingimonas lacisalsi]